MVLLQAGGFASLRLLRRSLQRWAAAVTAAVAARAAAELRLEAAVAALLAATARRVLAAWGEAANRLAVKRWMVGRRGGWAISGMCELCSKLGHCVPLHDRAWDWYTRLIGRMARETWYVLRVMMQSKSVQ